MDDGVSNDDDRSSQLGDPDIDIVGRDTLMPMIVSQLQYYGLNSIAQVVAEASETTLQYDPSSRLAELVARGLRAADEEDISDDEELPTALDEPSNPQNTSVASNTVTKPFEPLVPYFTTHHRDVARCAAFNSSGTLLATGSSDSSLKVIDVNRIKTTFREGSGEKCVIRTLYDHTAPVNDVCFHPNGMVLASCSGDESVKLFDVLRGGVKRSFRYLQDASQVRTLHFHPSGDFLACGTDHSALRLYDIHTLKCYTPPTSHSGAINKIRYNASGSLLASCSDDGTIKLWDTVTGDCAKTLDNAHGGEVVMSVKFSRSGKFLLSLGADSVGRLWDVAEGRCVQEYHGAVNKSVFTTSAFTHTEDHIIAPSEDDGSLCVWDTRTGEQVQRFSAHSAPIRCVVANPTEMGAVTCGDDFRARYWGEG
ncbi:WD40-repeat-containing domain protein [Gaertneriomyces semiglobifer]|nr:WD40-repeat-containing domain protein [Gaertneriomyces semiglobifer]